jgi:hypothetical protein
MVRTSVRALGDGARPGYDEPSTWAVLGGFIGTVVWVVAVFLALVYWNLILTPVGLVPALLGVPLGRFVLDRSWAISLVASGTVALLAPLMLFFSLGTVY